MRTGEMSATSVAPARSHPHLTHDLDPGHPKFSPVMGRPGRGDGKLDPGSKARADTNVDTAERSGGQVSARRRAVTGAYRRERERGRRPGVWARPPAWGRAPP